VRAAEFAFLFVALPLFAGWQGEVFKRWVIPQILVLGTLTLALLWNDPTFDRRRLRFWSGGALRGARRVLRLFAAGACALLVLVAAMLDGRIFSLPAANPALWGTVMLLYPVLSAGPQELAFRVFFFHRYRILFPGPRSMIAANAATFALAHLQLGNPIAPAMSLVGGALFAYTYLRSRSLALVSLEHALWGDWIFTVGMGSFFYGGHF
jgi:membrane protease YdiL (CAAX protease family)